MWYKNIAGRFFGLVTKNACDRQTDGQTDGQNYDSQDRASITASRGKNEMSHFFIVHCIIVFFYDNNIHSVYIIIVETKLRLTV